MASYLEKKLNDLVNLSLTNGVQPSDLADNIFLSEYNQIAFKKNKDSIVGELKFNETISKNTEEIILRYYYSSEGKVLSIEEEIRGRVVVVWDRTFTESQLVAEILSAMEGNYSKSQIKSFIQTLPANLQDKLRANSDRILG